MLELNEHESKQDLVRIRIEYEREKKNIFFF